MDNSLFVDGPPPQTDDSLFVDGPPPKEMGVGESAVRGAVNNFPLAPQAVAALGLDPTIKGTIGDYSKNLAEGNAKAAQAKEQNPVAYGIGAVGGSLAPLALPGVGEALKAAPFTGNAILGASNAISNENLVKQPGEAVNEAVTGGVLGGTIGSALNSIIPEASTIETAAQKAAVKSVPMSAKWLGRVAPEERQAVGKFIMDNGLLDGSAEDVLAKAKDVQKTIGSKIGQAGNQVDALGIVPKVSPAEMSQSLLAKAQSYANSSMPIAKKATREYLTAADDLASLGSTPTFGELQAKKEMFGGLAFNPASEVKNEAAADAYGVVSSALKDMVDQAQAHPALAQEYKDALGQYSTALRVEKGLEQNVAKNWQGAPGGGMGMMGAIRKMPAAIRYPAGVAGAMTGHPYLGVAAFAPELMNPANHAKVLQGLAAQRGNITQGISQELNDYLTSRYGPKRPQ